MFRTLGSNSKPLRLPLGIAAKPGRAPIRLLLELAGASAFLAAPILLAAQTPNALPAAPAPQVEHQLQPAPSGAMPSPSLLAPARPQDGIGKKATDMSPQGREPNDSPVVSMAPHPDGSLWWISGQANIILQGDLPFHSPYQGKNSFIGRGEYKTSMVGTLYTALRRNHSIRYNTDFVFDLEAAEGRGLSEAFGLAGFTNLDVVRNPNLGKAPYIARYQVHQVFGFTNKTTSQQPGFFALAPSVPLRRVEFRIGKLTLPDFFDVNGPGSDSHLQFMNWTIDNNGAWDYAADTRGYTVGGMAEYDDRSWSLRYGIFAMPVVANGIDLDWAFSRAHGQDGEFEWRHSLVSNRKGTQRVLFYANNAHMGTYREAVEGFLNGSDTAKYGVTVPTITLHEHFGALKYGFGYNTEQEVTENLRVFGRFGWNEGQHESFAYTEVDQTVELGADYAGSRWHRPVDKLGLAVVSNAIKADHQEYLKLGGLGFLLGDGTLNYGRENIEEGYYTWHFWRGMFYSLDVQHIDDPGYNRDRGPVWVGSIRAHVDF
jgi:high affinity Mn2+ porin